MIDALPDCRSAAGRRPDPKGGIPADGTSGTDGSEGSCVPSDGIPRTMTEKAPGIVGGVGPEATVDLFRSIVDRTPAETDQDHLRVFVLNDPKIPSRYEAIMGDGESPGPHVADAARRLETMGADFLAIASNLTHYYYDEARRAVDVPILHMIESVVERLDADHDVESVGVLVPTPTLEVELYQDELRRRGLTPVALDPEPNEELVDEPIYGPEGIKAGHIDKNREPLERAVRRLIDRGADVTILGCTELPLVLGGTGPDGDHDLVDANAVFAEAIVEEATADR